MQVIYANQTIPEDTSCSIFLAGPTPRNAEVASWRPAALQLLEDQGFSGIVFVPEDADNEWRKSYMEQVNWERAALDAAAVVFFWVPRDLKTMPGFTTNVEFGRYCTSGKAVLGFPEGAPKTRYLEWLAHTEGVPVFYQLPDTVSCAVEKANST